jgi:Skp family chaperone for outer membrane proteins
MLAQYTPVQFPFSVLDYGLTALALIAMAAIVWFFVRFLRETVKAQQGGVTENLKSLALNVERHTEVSRGMMNEFYHMAEELDHQRKEFYAFQEEQRRKDQRWDAIQEAETHQSAKERRQMLERLEAQEAEHRRLMERLGTGEDKVRQYGGDRDDNPSMGSSEQMKKPRRRGR